jgi:hypothetical protein
MKASATANDLAVGLAQTAEFSKAARIRKVRIFAPLCA